MLGLPWMQVVKIKTSLLIALSVFAASCDDADVLNEFDSCHVYPANEQTSSAKFGRDYLYFHENEVSIYINGDFVLKKFFGGGDYIDIVSVAADKFELRIYPMSDGSITTLGLVNSECFENLRKSPLLNERLRFY